LAGVGIEEEEFISTADTHDAIAVSAPIKGSDERIMLAAGSQ